MGQPLYRGKGRHGFALTTDGSPPLATNRPSDVPCPLPRRIERVRVSIASNGRRVGIAHCTFAESADFFESTPLHSITSSASTIRTSPDPFRIMTGLRSHSSMTPQQAIASSDRDVTSRASGMMSVCGISPR